MKILQEQLTTPRNVTKHRKDIWLDGLVVKVFLSAVHTQTFFFHSNFCLSPAYFFHQKKNFNWYGNYEHMKNPIK